MRMIEERKDGRRRKSTERSAERSAEKPRSLTALILRKREKGNERMKDQTESESETGKDEATTLLMLSPERVLPQSRVKNLLIDERYPGMKPFFISILPI